MCCTVILDTETNRSKNPEAVEVAFLSMDEEAINHLMTRNMFVQRYRPKDPIEFGAMAIHHITNENVENAKPSGSFVLPEGTKYIIGHHVDFDWEAIGKPEVKRICTLALCHSLWPDVDSHALGAMAYYLFPKEAKGFLTNAHSALADVLTCREVLACILATVNVSSWEELWHVSEEARVPSVIPFGKHKGMLIADLPSDYVSWLLRQDDIDHYLRIALINRHRPA